MNLGTGAQLFRWVNTSAGVATLKSANFRVDFYTNIRMISA